MTLNSVALLFWKTVRVVQSGNRTEGVKIIFFHHENFWCTSRADQSLRAEAPTYSTGNKSRACTATKAFWTELQASCTTAAASKQELKIWLNVVYRSIMGITKVISIAVFVAFIAPSQSSGMLYNRTGRFFTIFLLTMLCSSWDWHGVSC